MSDVWKRTQRETLSVPYGDQIRQGDIIRLIWNKLPSDEHKLGVVINADCDLAHKKTDGVIAYLPIYSLAEYVDHFYYWSSFVPRKTSEISHYLKTKFSLSDSELIEILDLTKRRGAETAAKALCSLESCNEKTKRKSLSLLVQFTELNRDDSGYSNLQRLAVIGENDPKDYLRKELLNAVSAKTLGSSHIFISDIFDEQQSGFILRLKRIHTLPFDALKKNCNAATSSLKRATRICRFSDLYRFKIAQQFAIQFSRIGLPDEISNLKPIAVDLHIGDSVE